MLSISQSQIQYVLALSRTGNFSEAADLCHITQSTLSTMIKRLEEQVNLKLFDRSSKPIQLTSEGEILIKQFRILNHEYENLQELISETRQELFGSLHIGIIPTVAPFLIPLFLSDLIDSYPNINFKIQELTTQEISNHIKTREIDIGILSIPIKGKDFHLRSLYKEDFLIYDIRTAGYPKRKYRVEDIDLSRLWLLEESHCMTHQIGKICHLKNKRNLNQNLEYKSGSILTLLQLVNMNKGLTLLPRLATLNKSIIKEKNLYAFNNPCPVREIGMITHVNFSKKRLLDILEQEITTAVKPYLKRIRNIEVINPE